MNKRVSKVKSKAKMVKLTQFVKLMHITNSCLDLCGLKWAKGTIKAACPIHSDTIFTLISDKWDIPLFYFSVKVTCTQGTNARRCMHFLYCSVFGRKSKHKTEVTAWNGIHFHKNNLWNILVIGNNYVNYQNYQN